MDNINSMNACFSATTGLKESPAETFHRSLFWMCRTWKWNYENTQINHWMDFDLMCQTAGGQSPHILTCEFTLQSHRRISNEINQMLCTQILYFYSGRFVSMLTMPGPRSHIDHQSNASAALQHRTPLVRVSSVCVAIHHLHPTH